MKKLILTLLLIFLVSTVYGATSTSTAAGEHIRVTLINQEPDPVPPGGLVDVRFRIENIGTEPATDMKVRIVPKFPATVYGENIRDIGSIAGGQADDIGVREKFTIAIDSLARDGENEIEFFYRIGNLGWVKAGDFVLDVRSRDPVLAINKISTTPSTVTPGSTSKVVFDLENLAGSPLNDVKLQLQVLTSVVTTTSIQSVELPFTPLGSTNEKTVRTIAPGRTERVDFNLFTDADAESKVYKIPYTLTYADDAGENFTRAGVVGLLVDALPDISVNLESTDILADETKGTVSIKFVNKGFSDIKFLDVILKQTDEFDILSNQEVYIGDLDSDDFENADYDILVQKGSDGPLDLPLHIEYRDANGELFEKDISIKLPLYSGQDLKKRSDGNSGGGFTGILIVIVIVVVGIIIYRRRKRKKDAK